MSKKINEYFKNNYKSSKKKMFKEGGCHNEPKVGIFLENIINNHPFMKTKKIKNVLEIGFNTGHSADIFLSNNEKINLISFDIGLHDYVKIGKEYIDKEYKNRHRLILGDSTKTIPEFINSNTDNLKFDLIYIDGGHEYNIAKQDLINCKRLAHKNSLVILDDVVRNKNNIKFWNEGPNKSWDECKKINIIHEIGQIDYNIGRGVAYGKYII